MDMFLGTILPWPMDWAPKNWKLCDGSLLPISQNAALFALLGTTYGGDGKNTFGLPDLRGRVPLGMGQQPGRIDYSLGEIGGNDEVSLRVAEMPQHTHAFALPVSNNDADTSNPTNLTCLARGNTSGGDNANIYSSSVPNIAMTGQTPAPPFLPIGVAGGSQPFDNKPPYLVLNYIICVYGIFPSRG